LQPRQAICDWLGRLHTEPTYRVPGVNNLGTFGLWEFAEFTEVYRFEADFKAKVESQFDKMIDGFVAVETA